MKNLQLESFFRLSSDLLCILDQQRCFTMVNPTFTSALGYTMEDLDQKPYTCFVHPDDQEATCHQVNNLFEGRAIYQFENRYITKDGRVVWLSWSSAKMDDGCYYAAAKDITLQKKAEESLETSEKKFRSLVQNGYELISIIGVDGTYTYHSDSSYRMLGYRPEQIIGLKARDLIHPEDLEKIGRATSLLQTQPYVNNLIPYRIKAADGSYRWLESSGTNMLDDPLIRGIVVNSRDVTEKKRLEEQLRQQKLQQEKQIAITMIQAQERERTRLAQELHDNINQLLTSVKLYNDYMKEDPSSRESLLEKSGDIIRIVMEEIRKLSHSLVLPGVEAFNLKQGLEEFVADLLLTSTIDVQINLTDLDRIQLNEDMKMVLYRIVQEQMTNVIKHAQASHVSMTVLKRENQLELSIADNGIGFDTSAPRNGIGLLNIKNRASAFGGTTKIVAAPGQGCSLILHFPLQ